MFRVTEGELFEAINTIEVSVVISFKAPFTDGVRVVLQPGARMKALSGSRDDAEGFYCIPIEKEAFEKKYIPEQIIYSNKYAGYALLIYKADLSVNFKRLPN